jgi:hypothetical protein
MINATLLTESLTVRPRTSAPAVSFVRVHPPSKSEGCSPRSTLAFCLLATVEWMRKELRNIFPK